MLPKLSIPFRQVNIAQKKFHLLEIVYTLEKILLNEKAANQPFIESTENILSILLVLGLLWLQQRDTNRNLKHYVG